jgi:hypothetical protein
MDLTSLANVKITVTNRPPVADDPLISGLITALSDAVENYCNQTFGVSTVNQVGSNSSYQAVIDADGILTFYPPHNHITAVTALQFRQRGSLTWQSLDPANLDIHNQDCGPVLGSTAQTSLGYRALTPGSRSRLPSPPGIPT